MFGLLALTPVARSFQTFKCAVATTACLFNLVFWPIIVEAENAAEIGNSEACGNPRRTILSHIVEGDLDSAYKLSVICEKFLEHNFDSVNLSGIYLRMQYLVSSQILALKGDVAEAEKKRLAAEKLERSDLVIWDTFEDGTMGLILEKSNKLEDALQWYGAHQYSHTDARRA